jgi:hypothetical protein
MSITLNGTTGITSPAITSDVTGAINGFTPQASNMQPFNRIINGAMTIDQRNAGAAIASGYAIDRFQTVLTGIPSLVISSQQSTNVPTGSGFTNSYFTTVTTPATSYSTGGRYGILHRIEGNNVSDFLFGSASAKVVTISFWVRASVTGQYSVTIYNSDSNRAYPAIYTISAVDAWEKKVITIQGDNTGVWLTDNGRGFQVEWALGNDASILGTPDVWNSAFITGATGNVRISDTSGATFYITGVQLEAGSTASPFAHENVGDTLRKCERFYQKVPPLVGQGNNTDFYGAVAFRTEMRAQPSISLPSNSLYWTDGYASAYLSTNANPSWEAYSAHYGGRFKTFNHAAVLADARRGTMMLVSGTTLNCDSEL